ncbi:hypothetical protein C8Q79DRAFT_933791 [Trametes meyenii]|nr:hypothetical protein C8Q79DRAFT_933791 [Trametes meyenii]
MMSSSLPTTAQLDSAKTGNGAWLVGTFIAAVLDGMLLQQTLRYFRLYPSDPGYMKIWVVIAVILQLLTAVFTMHTSYYYLVIYYMDPVSFTKPAVWTGSAVLLLEAISNAISESFFARRVYMIGKEYRIVALSAMVMVLASCGCFIAVSVHALADVHLVSTGSTGLQAWLPTIGSVLLLIGDLQLTIVLVYFLHKHKTNVRRTNSMLNILIAYTISSGTLICVLNVASLILSIVYVRNIIYTASTFVVQSVYTNSFIVALNTRQYVRSSGETEEINLEGGIVLGERPSDTAVNRRRSQLPSELVFASRVGHSRALETNTDIGRRREGTSKSGNLSTAPVVMSSEGDSEVTEPESRVKTRGFSEL